MNEFILKLNAQIEGINTLQADALTSSEAPGCSAEDRAKHLAEFDRLEDEKTRLKSSLKRAQTVAADQAAANAPARAAIVQEVHNPLGAIASGTITVPATARRHGKLKAFRGPNAERDAYTAGLWAAAALYGHGPSIDACRQHGVPLLARVGDDWRGTPAASLGVGTGNSNQGGNIFVPDIVETTIIEITQQFGVVRRLAEVVPMQSDTSTTPRWSQAMIAYWIGRGQKPTQSDPAWNGVQLIAKDLGAYTKVARQLNEDSLINLGDKVTMNIAFAFSYAEDNAAINGDGSSTYGGITGAIALLLQAANSSSLIAAAATHSTAAKLTMADYLSVVGSFPDYPNADPVWVCHKSVWATSMVALQISPISGSAGGNKIEDIAGGGTPQFLGYPVVFSQVMPTAAAATSATSNLSIPVLFGDWELACKIGDRRGRTVQAGYENDDFTRQLLTLLGTQRVDINVHTITDPKNPTTQPGPMLGLQLTT